MLRELADRIGFPRSARCALRGAVALCRVRVRIDVRRQQTTEHAVLRPSRSRRDEIAAPTRYGGVSSSNDAARTIVAPAHVELRAFPTRDYIEAVRPCGTGTHADRRHLTPTGLILRLPRSPLSARRGVLGPGDGAHVPGTFPSTSIRSGRLVWPTAKWPGTARGSCCGPRAAPSYRIRR